MPCPAVRNFLEISRKLGKPIPEGEILRRSDGVPAAGHLDIDLLQRFTGQVVRRIYAYALGIAPLRQGNSVFFI